MWRVLQDVGTYGKISCKAFLTPSLPPSPITPARGPLLIISSPKPTYADPTSASLSGTLLPPRISPFAKQLPQRTSESVVNAKVSHVSQAVSCTSYKGIVLAQGAKDSEGHSIPLDLGSLSSVQGASASQYVPCLARRTRLISQSGTPRIP